MTRPMVRPRVKRAAEHIDALVLACLQASARPLSAYQIADTLAVDGNKLSPVQAYRTLARLICQGRACRVETRSTYAACNGDEQLLLVCESCGALQTIKQPRITKKIEGLALNHGFTANRIVLEVLGMCASCTGEQAPKPLLSVEQKLSLNSLHDSIFDHNYDRKRTVPKMFRREGDYSPVEQAIRNVTTDR